MIHQVYTWNDFETEWSYQFNKVKDNQKNEF